MTAVLLLPAANGQFGTDIVATFYNNITTDLRYGLTIADNTFIPKADGKTVAQLFARLQSLVNDLTSVQSLNKTLNKTVGRMQQPSHGKRPVWRQLQQRQRKQWPRDYSHYHGVPRHDQMPPSCFNYPFPRRRRDPGNGSASVFHGALPSFSGRRRDAQGYGRIFPSTAVLGLQRYSSVFGKPVQPPLDGLSQQE
jgi:hypothetical protein